MLHALRKLKAGIKLRLLDHTYRSQRNLFAPPTSAVNSVLVLPAADGWEGSGPHGFGDEMLMLGLLKGLEGRFAGRISAVSMAGQGGEVFLHGSRIVVTGFRKSWLSLSSYAEFAAMASLHSHFVVIGADVLDGAYGAANSIQRLRFLEIASRLGLATSITGCSFNGTNSPEIRRLLKRLSEGGAAIHARDEVSLERLREFINPVRKVADLAFAVDAANFPHADPIARITSKAADWRSAGGIVVGLNLCGWHITDKVGFFDRFIPELLKLRQSEKIALVLLPHDTRTNRWSDLDTLEEFRERLADRIEVIGAPAEIRCGIDAKHAAGACDVLLTGRMHLAIAAHDQGVPSVSFGYQGKFEGFYALYGMGAEWLVDYADPRQAVERLREAIASRCEASARILRHRDGIRTAAARNFSWLDPVADDGSLP